MGWEWRPKHARQTYDFGVRDDRRGDFGARVRRYRPADGDRERLRSASLRGYDAIRWLPCGVGTIRSPDGRDCGRGRMPSRFVRRILRWRERWATVPRALWPLRSHCAA